MEEKLASRVPLIKVDFGPGPAKPIKLMYLERIQLDNKQSATKVTS